MHLYIRPRCPWTGKELVSFCCSRKVMSTIWIIIDLYQSCPLPPSCWREQCILQACQLPLPNAGLGRAILLNLPPFPFADTIRRNIDLGLMTGAVFLDLRKVFDTVDQSTLLGKLFTIGVTGQEQTWFDDYLSGCSQVVGFNSVVSDSEPVTIRIPQGSILGALLFILYVNHWPDVICKCSILMYVDNTYYFVQA